MNDKAKDLGGNSEGQRQVKEPLPSDVWQHAEHGQQWHREGRCESCYTMIWPPMFDYDDD